MPAHVSLPVDAPTPVAGAKENPPLAPVVAPIGPVTHDQDVNMYSSKQLLLTLQEQCHKSHDRQ